MRIERIIHIGLEHRPAPADRYGSGQAMIDSRQASLVIVHTDAGATGLGDARGPVGLVRAALEFLAPHFLGCSTFEIARIWSELGNRFYHFAQDRVVRAGFSGLDIAVHDATARDAGVSLAQLLGGAPDTPVVPYATCGYLTDDGLDGLARQLEQLPLGLGGAKIKIGIDPADDERRVDLARQILGPDLPLMVDANANYTPDLALASMRRVADFDIEWYEEPVPPWDLAGYTWLHRVAPMPIAAGEAHSGAREFLALLDTDAVDVLQPNLCSVGGLREATMIADAARTRNKRVVAAVWDSGVGLAAALQWTRTLRAASSSANPPRPRWVEYDVIGSPLRDAVLQEPLALREGTLTAPGRLGLGVDLDDDAVARYTILPAQTWRS